MGPMAGGGGHFEGCEKERICFMNTQRAKIYFQWCEIFTDAAEESKFIIFNYYFGHSLIPALFEIS